VDPYWCSPQLDLGAVSDPANPEFYDPTWWLINGTKYHKSHLAIFRTQQPADILKPSYMYGGIPVPQQIMERVYAAERCANEAPQLAMTKRLTVWNTDLEALYANQDNFAQHMANFANLRDNFGVKINDTDDTMQQFDTTLTDVDVLTMTQYQLVAAAGGVPATKILGTSPKGFNSTGEYDEASYHEHLEDIQENDLTPFLEHHLRLVLKSELRADPAVLDPHVEWNPTDSPTGKEIAERNLATAQADQIYAAVGAIDGTDIRDRLRTTRDSGYFGITDAPDGDDPVKALEDATAALEALAGEGGGDPLDEATMALVHHPLERATAALHNA
jgi:phage-related protein (TIGR01555 family)